MFKLAPDGTPQRCASNDPDLWHQATTGRFIVGRSALTPSVEVATSFDIVAGNWITTVDADGYACADHEVRWDSEARAQDGHKATTEWVRSLVEAAEVAS